MRDLSYARARTQGARLHATVLLCAALLAVALASCAPDDRSPTATADLPPGTYPPAGTPGATQPAAALQDIGLRFTRIASVGSRATAFMSDARRENLYIGRQDGLILRIRLSGRAEHLVPELDTEPTLDLSSQVLVGEEKGLFDLQLLAGDRAAVTYTDLDGAVTVRLLRVDGSGRLVDDVERDIVFTIANPMPGHNGGGLALDAHGDLLVSVGDMSQGGNDPPASQDLTSPLGAILRIPASALDDPAARPIAALADLAIAKGLRNPWRIARDAVTDRLWIGDVGDETWEETNVIPNVSTRTERINFGWPEFEGDARSGRDGTTIATDDPVLPVAKYGHSPTECAETGGVVYRGDTVQALFGTYLYGDNCGGAISGLRAPDDDQVETAVLGDVGDGIVSFGEDAAKELYVLTNQGHVYRIDPAGWVVDDVAGSVVPNPSHTATTTAPVAAPAEAECLLPAAFADLARFPSMAPDEARRAATGLLAILDRLIVEAPLDRRAADETIRNAIVALTAIAEARGWNVQDPEVHDGMTAIQNGAPPYDGFPEALSIALAATDQC